MLQSKIDEMKSQLAELENERANHQKLIKEHSKLEQRFEKVRSDLLRYSKNNLNSTASLSSSTTSFNQHNSELESLIEELEQDTTKQVGLNMHKTQSGISNEMQSDVANFESNKLLYMTPNGSEMDISLINKLHRRIASLELGRNDSTRSTSSRTSLNQINERHSENNNEIADNPQLSSLVEKLQQDKDFEIIKSQELELENQKLREDLTRLRDLVSDNQVGKTESAITKEMIGQFDALNEEVQRRRDECIQLKSLLIAKHRAVNQSQNHSDLDNNNFSDNLADLSSINTDGNEYEIGYNTQKILNRFLENQMSELKKSSDFEKANLLKEIKVLRDENEKNQDLLMQNLSPENLADATYKNEIMKLADHNLELSEKCDKYSEEIKKYKKMLKVYIKRSKTSNPALNFDFNFSNYFQLKQNNKNKFKFQS